MADSRMPVPVADSSVKRVDRALLGRLRHHRRHLLDQVVQARDREAGREEAVEPGLDRRQAPDEDEHGQDDPGRPGADHVGTRMRVARRPIAGPAAAASRGLVPLERDRAPDLFGRQTRRKRTREAIETMAAMMSTSSGPMKLDTRYCGIAKRHAGHQDGRPDLHHRLAPGEGPDQPERHQQREERQLAADHGRDLHQVVAVHLGQRDDRRAERAEGHRRGVGDQRKARGGERREAEADQDRRRHGHRRAEAGRALEEGAEGERDQQQLQAPVLGDAGERILQHLEAAVLLGRAAAGR